jgi:DNA repair protein SbcD/Mre11
VRFLHTGDWHVGRALQGRSRAAEHEAVLAEIAQVARSREVDAVLVAGDVFDSAAPSPEAERVVYKALLDLADVAPVVVVAGNHDSDRRLAALAPLFDLARVHVRAGVDRSPVEIPGDGRRALVACIPWLSQRYIVKAAQLMNESAAVTRGLYEERMALIVDELTEPFGPDTVNLILGHLTLAGAETGGGEREAQTIFDYWVNATLFPSSAHYVALGHMHKMQSMPGACPIHYCGSPLQLDFSDDEGAKHALVVDASPGVPASVEPVALGQGRRLQTIRGTMDDLKSLTDKVGDAYLRVIVNEPARVGLAEGARVLADLLAADLVAVRLVRGGWVARWDSVEELLIRPLFIQGYIVIVTLTPVDSMLTGFAAYWIGAPSSQ